MILLALTLRLSIPQFGTQLMVRRSYVPFYCNNNELNIFLVIADTNVGSLEPIQPDVIGASSAAPLQIEAITEKVLYPLHHPFCYELIQTS